MGEEGGHVVPRDAPDRRRRPERVAPERMVREERALPALGGQVRRLVGVHQDLVEDHRALCLDVVGAQRRRPHDVAQDVEAERQVVREEAHVEGRVLLRGEGVAVTAHLVELLGDRRCRAPWRPLEEEVLQEVRRAGELAGLVTRAGADPVGDRNRADIRHGLGDQADAARQDRRLDQRRRERPREGRRSLPRSPRSPRSGRPPSDVGRARAEIAQVGHELGLERVLEGGGAAVRATGRGRGPRRSVTVGRAAAATGRAGARPRAPRRARGRPCPGGRCRRPAPRRPGPA